MAFELRSVAAASVPGGTGVLIVYRRNSAPDEVTGRQYRDEVQRYELVSQCPDCGEHGTIARMSNDADLRCNSCGETMLSPL